MKHTSNRPSGLPTATALMWFWVFAALLLLDVALWQHMQLLEVLG